MDIIIKNRKLKAALENKETRQRQYGQEMARKIEMRLLALRAAQSLADFWPPLGPPERCHELTANLAGTFSVDVKHPYRLLFVPIDAPDKSEIPNEKERWAKITSIEILGIEDTHG